MADIFISYAHEDQRRVRPLVNALEKQRWSVFWDRQIPAGQTWDSHIGAALEQARCVLVLWSVHSVNSSAVKEEAGEAARRGRLLPVRLDAVEPPLGRGFRDIQFADLTGQKPGRPSAPLRNLLKDIAKLMESSAGEAVGERHRAGPESLKPTARETRGRLSHSPPAHQRVQVGELRFPKQHPNAHVFWDGRREHLGPREISVPVTFDTPFARPPSVIVSLRELDLGDASIAGIHRVSVRAENVRETGFDLCFATWMESQIYGAVASWIAVGE